MDGIIPIWKERGMTSHDCIYKVRKILGTKKVGHSGTLDPNVDGVLPIGIGKGTKMMEYVVDSSKVYTGEITIGFSTTTEDLDGDIVEQVALAEDDLQDEQISQVLTEFEGIITQIPPLYSAIRVDGKRLYEYARNNEEVVRPKREVNIHSFEKTSEIMYNVTEQTYSFTFKVECSKGTYIRTLAVDIGKELGFPATMTQLTRISSGGFNAKDAVRLDQLAELKKLGQLDCVMKPIETALTNLAYKVLSEEEWLKVKHGALLKKASYPATYPLVFYYQDKAVAIYEAHPRKTHLIKPKKVLQTEL